MIVSVVNWFAEHLEWNVKPLLRNVLSVRATVLWEYQGDLLSLSSPWWLLPGVRSLMQNHPLPDGWIRYIIHSVSQMILFFLNVLKIIVKDHPLKASPARLV